MGGKSQVSTSIWFEALHKENASAGHCPASDTGTSVKTSTTTTSRAS